MPVPGDFLDPAALGRIERLEVVARGLVDGLLRGHHLGPHHGASTEFLDHRPYVRGDEIRHLDWRTFAKSERFYLKQFADETTLRGHLVIDASASMGASSGGISKLRYASCLAAALGYILLRQRDAVSLSLLDSSLRVHHPARGTAEHLWGIFRSLESAKASGETDLGGVLHQIAERIPLRSLVMVISDLFDDVSEILSGLGHLRHREDEVIVFHLVDPAEAELPVSGWAVFRDPEEPSRAVRIDTRVMRREYAERRGHWERKLREGCSAAGIDYAMVSTTTPFEASLARYLDVRGRLS